MFWLFLAHFVGDWMFQPYSMAMRKARHHGIRAIHCTIYTACMATALVFTIPLDATFWRSLAWIWITHFAIDTYLPLYWWVKYVHRDPHAESVEAFVESFKNPRQILVYVVLDQVMHVITLAPIFVWARLV